MPAPNPRPAYLLDTNVFVAAIRDAGRETDTLRLILKLVGDPRVRLVADDLLAEEFTRYAEVFPSPTARLLVVALLGRLDVIRPREALVEACKPHILTPSVADLVHAAACLETGATMISNDRHFRHIAKAGLIRWITATEAIRELL
jgi:predicted nucleic acid-binding protein